MAVRGQRPKSNALHIVDGTYEPSRHDGRMDGPEATGKPVKPKLRAAASRIWDRSAERFHWLTAADSDKLALYCQLMAEFEKDPEEMTTARIGQLRNLGSELGGDPVSRTRMGTGKQHGKSKEDKFF